MATVERTHHARGRREGLTTLEQRFLFGGEGADAQTLSAVLLTAPLTGAGSIFGDRPGETNARTEQSWTVQRFSPAPGFSFDVDLTQRSDGEFVVRFSQPERRVPYLEGEFLWTVTDEPGGAVLDEQINTESAHVVVSEPLHGARPSIRRWLFFRAGHQQVMSRMTNNVAALLSPGIP